MPNGRQKLFELLGIEEALAWQSKALCTGCDPDLFFPEKGGDSPATSDEAKKVCRKCPVQMECLEYALVNGEKHGIWGGANERERRRIRRTRAQAARRERNRVEAASLRQ